MWCVDHLWFYGEPEFGIGDGQFGQCNFTATWSEKELVWRDEQFGWTDTYHDHSRIDCHIGDIKGLQSISYKVCSEDYVPASHSNFYARFENGNGGTCTMPLKPNTKAYKRNEFVKVDEITGMYTMYV